MATTQTDLRALRRGPQTTSPNTQPPPSSAGSTTVIARPRARWATRLLIPAAVLLATGGLLAYAARDALRPRLAVHVAAAIPKESVQAAGTSAAPGSPSDPEAPPHDAPLGPAIVQAPGWIEPAPFAVSVPALAEGVVRDVLVLEGERIEAGQAVAHLIDEDARLSLRAAEATVAQRDRDVARAQAALATDESQVAVKGAAVAELRDEVTRKRDLVPSGAISEGAFRRLEIRLQGAEAEVVAAEKVVTEARAALAQAEAAHAAAHVLRDEAALRLARMEVRSPVAGVVLARLVEPGSRISMSGKGGDPGPAGSMTGAVLRVYDPEKLQVRVDVPLADAAKVGVGTRAMVTTEALSDQTFSGVVTRVVHEANIQRNTVQFKVALDAPSPVLKPEMLTRVKFHASASAAQRRSAANGGRVSGGLHDTGTMTLLVPTAAVTLASDGKGQVWVVDTSGGGPVARRRDIAIVPSTDDGFTAVTSGLRLTDRIILDPPAAPAIQDGTRLKVLGERTAPSSEPASSTP